MPYPAGKELLPAGSKLYPGEYLVSPNRECRAIFQDDGNFVVYRLKEEGGEEVVWAASQGTSLRDALCTTKAAFLAVQGDNNIVTYTLFAGEEAPVWASNTCGKGTGQATLALGDLGLLVLVDQKGKLIWSTAKKGVTDVFGMNQSHLHEAGHTFLPATA
eukprot:jgi/Botrbrau1/14965/Bobra.0018s0068.1